ncbi:hypothetical protein [Novosphingobium panipatense]|uniref:hypothetical protein n=1 Tax=Novosphingobium panipatense TaxID=428991 RepID=UPI00361DA013
MAPAEGEAAERGGHLTVMCAGVGCRQRGLAAEHAQEEPDQATNQCNLDQCGKHARAAERAQPTAKQRADQAACKESADQALRHSPDRAGAVLPACVCVCPLVADAAGFSVIDRCTGAVVLGATAVVGSIVSARATAADTAFTACLGVVGYGNHRGEGKRRYDRAQFTALEGGHLISSC